jgi:two-component system, cell cycle sensor histidine kinase and response regulator CckA
MIQPPLREGTGKAVLLVDDERALLKVMSLYLGRLGYEVQTAETADRASAAVHESGAALAAAVLDASLDGLSVEDLASNLLTANPRLCVVVASGYPVDMTTLEPLAPGRVVFLQKPFTAERLAATLRRMIGAQEEDV